MPRGSSSNDPRKTTFDELVARAAKAKCGEQVRTAALRFLETGDLAISVAQGRADASRRFRLAAPTARLSCAALHPSGRMIAPHGPHYDVLLDMAIAAKRPDDVLRWYDKMLDGRKRESRGWASFHRVRRSRCRRRCQVPSRTGLGDLSEGTGWDFAAGRYFGLRIGGRVSQEDAADYEVPWP